MKGQDSIVQYSTEKEKRWELSEGIYEHLYDPSRCIVIARTGRNYAVRYKVYRQASQGEFVSEDADNLTEREGRGGQRMEGERMGGEEGRWG